MIYKLYLNLYRNLKRNCRVKRDGLLEYKGPLFPRELAHSERGRTTWTCVWRSEASNRAAEATGLDLMLAQAHHGDTGTGLQVFVVKCGEERGVVLLSGAQCVKASST